MLWMIDFLEKLENLKAFMDMGNIMNMEMVTIMS